MTERDQERGDGRDPIDEEAAWAEIIAGYGEEPADPPGVWPRVDELDRTDTADRVPASEPAGTPAPLDGSGDWQTAEDQLLGEDDDHFVPPEPPPLPETDLTTKLAWLAVLGGPSLLFIAALCQLEMSWWLVTVGVGGFLGGFATLLTRLRGDDETDDPRGGAVV